jgi:branched-chain amino acid transport system ATP-binding protein
MSEPQLAVTDLHVAYGPIKALRGVTIHANEGETIAVLGANGSGKTTLLRAISNMLARQQGTVRINGADTAGVPAHRLVREGLLHVPEGRGTIGRLTVLENLRLAYDLRPTAQSFEAALELVFARFPRLGERIAQRAGNLSGGEQQMLTLARAIVNRPRLLLVDEPSLGLSPVMVDEAFAVLREFQASGMTILIVEQNVRKTLRFAQRAYILRQGQIVSSGSGADLLHDPAMLNHYLGAS